MKYIKPAFYDEFLCKADKCAHSCCIGWEIDIDAETLEIYDALRHPIAEEIRSNIVRSPEAHFCLTGEGRCPFLREDGLCRMILALGEDALCNICAEHPRFYNEYPGLTEAGLGLCCERAAELLLTEPFPLSFVYEDDGDACEDQSVYITRKYGMINALSDLSLSLNDCFGIISERLGEALPKGSISDWAGYFLTLERMDEEWGKRLEALSECDESISDALDKAGETERKLAAYLVFRHYNGEKKGVSGFVMLSTALLSALNRCFDDAGELVRLFSSEIEYSDENIDAIIAKIRAYLKKHDCLRSELKKYKSYDII